MTDFGGGDRYTIEASMGHCVTLPSLVVEMILATEGGGLMGWESVVAVDDCIPRCRALSHIHPSGHEP